MLRRLLNWLLGTDGADYVTGMPERMYRRNASEGWDNRR